MFKSLLLFAFYLAFARAGYTEDNPGASSCPDGYEIVDSELECENNAATFFDKPYERADCWDDNEFTGCFSNVAKVYFSNCVGSSTNGNRSPVCKKAFADTCQSVGGYVLKRRERLRAKRYMADFNKNPEECVQECEANSNCGSVEIRVKDQKKQSSGFVCRLFSYHPDGREDMKPDNRYCSYLKSRNCVGAFGGWTQCSATCGGGVRSRTFSVTTKAMFEGQCSHADGETEEGSCGNAACPSPAYKCKDSNHNCALLASYGWCTSRMYPHVKLECPATCGICGDLPTEESRVAHIKSENNKLKQANEALRKALETLSN